jgi:hypothetical protein
VAVRDAQETSLDPDQLFNALDGRTVSDTYRSWPIEVYSVYDRQDGRWIQVSLQGQPQRACTLRVSPHEGADQILRKLSTQLADPDSTDEAV